jgi:hypothetical protein
METAFAIFRLLFPGFIGINRCLSFEIVSKTAGGIPDDSGPNMYVSLLPNSISL